MTHTVLVVEDERELREMMRDALELNGTRWSPPSTVATRWRSFPESSISAS